jgi:hypothetical protein
MGGLGKLHNELCNLYSLPSIIRIVNARRMRWAEHVARMRGEQKLTWKTKSRWVDNIKMYLRGI